MDRTPSTPRRQLLRRATLACAAALPVQHAMAQSAQSAQSASDAAGHASIRRGRIKPGAAAEVAKRVREQALPVLRSIVGFRGYWMLHGADEALTVVTVYATREAAEESNRRILPWIRENLAPLMAGPLEASETQVIVAATA